MRPEYLGTCTWGQAGGTLLSGRSVVIGLKTGPAFDIGKGLAAARRRPLRGIGDEAYYAGAGQGGRRPILNVKKGGMAFNIAVYGDVPPERAKAMERALAKQILGRL